MRYNKMGLSKIYVIAILVLVLAVAGCASTSTPSPTEMSPGPGSEADKLITAIATEEDSDFYYVTVTANQPLTYTSVKQESPLGVIFYFPETALDAIPTDYSFESNTVAGIKASVLAEKGSAARIEVQLKNDVTPSVSSLRNGIKISFAKPPAVSVIEKPAKEEIKEEIIKKEEIKVEEKVADLTSLPSATKLESIYTVQSEKHINIKLLADGVIKDYKAFTIANPPRIVFDIPKLKLAQSQKKEQLLPVKTEWVKSVRYFGYSDKLRLVIDTSKPYLASYVSAPTENGLQIQVGPGASVTAASLPDKVAETIPPQEKPEPPPVKAKDAQASLTPAWINRIDFSSEQSGKSTLIIGTTRPIQYEAKKEGDKRIQLKLMDARLPDYRKRPLITTRFQSAVDRILPFDAPAIKDTTLVAIELREAVPYVVEQADALLLVHFEASAIPPKPLDESKLPAWQTVMTQTAIAAAEPEKTAGQLPAAIDRSAPKGSKVVVEEPFTGTTKEYTGEKIALDFYDTDIKNVFRILREVSRKNFAIDKGVAGKVTLTLEQPVPWDQVLDLILKMNGLDMTYEGDIIRIAKQETIEKEQKALQAKLASERKAKREEEKEVKELEPLATEYVSVNYANATSEVLPKVKPLTTKGRGDITVDDRNNQLIVTDVAGVIEQIREVVRKIDKVTPQVLIEARIVEATNTFTRSIGTQWGVTGGPNDNITDALGGALTYDMSAINPPTSTLGTIGMNFTRLLGTPFSLVNARLSASETEGDVNIISAPRILTLNNKKATIKQGVKYPYNKLVDGETQTEFFEVNLELQVEPLVTPDERVNMKLKVTNNELGSVINGQQSFTTKEAETELLVNDGETIVIGGIRKITKDNTVSGVPAMKDIPVLGWLFKSKGITDNKEELLIFITPQIVQLEQRGS